ncbi:hypothetical protein K402DRAFT_69345 [Aulographum hederae CBS 113979]|uniref:Bromodomain associated domain-containing protein n=1 Tax=Aulographum hederae CBS 113979 TaxID=1176131 RepID=A0A6G1HFH2_9PEZI|nr:hypothetical protein K402DRAFT_69345 [Aulographum hederae CBS 113979]
MSASDLHNALLRPAIIQIFRAAGYTSMKPSVLDTLTDLTIRYLTLLGSKTAEYAYSNHNDPVPDITDVRMAFQECAVFSSSSTPAEEIWREKMRRPLSMYPEGQREMEVARRNDEDTAEIAEFTSWFQGRQHLEICRVAGMLSDKGIAVEGEAPPEMEDYLTALKKKHSKTGEESRFQGTVLGKFADPRDIKIEGESGTPESVQEWMERQQKRSVKLDAVKLGNGYAAEEAEPEAGEPAVVEMAEVAD